VAAVSGQVYRGHPTLPEQPLNDITPVECRT
jgi:hypothetical protein